MDSVALRERNRRRRNKQARFKFEYAVDAVYAAALITMIVGWAIPLTLMSAAAGHGGNWWREASRRGKCR